MLTMKYFTVLLVAVSLLAGCVSDAPPKPKPRIAQPKNPYSGQGKNVIFEGTVVSRKPSPEAWSSMFTFFQGIEYRVDKVIEGEITGGNVVVYHNLAPSPLTEKEIPELSLEIFKVGNKLHVECERTRDNDLVELYGPKSVKLLSSK